MTDLSKQSSEGLTGVDPSDDDVADIEKRVRGAYAQELEDAIRYRRRFFWWGVGITSVCVSASIGMIVFLVLQDVYETPVGVAFIGGLAVRKDLRGKKGNGSVGAALLCHAVHMACDLSVMAGGRLVMLDPLNDTLGKWYEDHGFLRLPNAKTMFMPLRNARSYMEQIGEPFFVF